MKKREHMTRKIKLRYTASRGIEYKLQNENLESHEWKSFPENRQGAPNFENETKIIFGRGFDKACLLDTPTQQRVYVSENCRVCHNIPDEDLEHGVTLWGAVFEEESADCDGIAGNGTIIVNRTP